MARLIYACRFEVQSTTGLSPMLSAYNSWIEGHYRNRRGLISFKYDLASSAPAPVLPNKHIILKERFTSGRGDVVRLVWAFPDDFDSGLEWRNEISNWRIRRIRALEHQILIGSIEYNITPTRLMLGAPAVIRHLCSETTVRIGDMRVKATPYPLSCDGVDQFVELLKSPKRRLPMVFISPYANGDPNALDATLMAKNLAGVGIVVEVKDPEATWDVSDEIGRTLSCFDGGARIYWPRFSDTDSPRRHGLYLSTVIEDMGRERISRTIEKSIFDIAAFRFAPDPRISEAVHEAEQAKRIERVEVEKASSGENWGKLRNRIG